MSYKNRWKDITTSGWINDSNINICLMIITLTTIIVKYWSFKPQIYFENIWNSDIKVCFSVKKKYCKFIYCKFLVYCENNLYKMFYQINIRKQNLNFYKRTWNIPQSIKMWTIL